MSTFSVMHWATLRGLDPYELLPEIPESEEYGIGPKVIPDPSGNRWHDEYHDVETIRQAAQRLEEKRA